MFKHHIEKIQYLFYFTKILYIQSNQVILKIIYIYVNIKACTYRYLWRRILQSYGNNIKLYINNSKYITYINSLPFSCDT